MYFERKVYRKLLDWKDKYSEKYAVLLEGARRVGKSTIAEHFAQNEYKSYILIDFSKTTDNIRDCFNDIGNLNMFFLRLQAETGITLYEHESLIILDEVQLFPKARQAIKHLVSDGRYSYLETGSLISIKKNVKDILIPSEERKLQMHPMDYEEFLWALDDKTTMSLLKMTFDNKKKLSEHAFNNVEDIERNNLNQGRILKVTDIGMINTKTQGIIPLIEEAYYEEIN